MGLISPDFNLYTQMQKEHVGVEKVLVFRRGDRVAECTGLENQRAFTGTVGSNPTLSAIFFRRI